MIVKVGNLSDSLKLSDYYIECC